MRDSLDLGFHTRHSATTTPACATPAHAEGPGSLHAGLLSGAPDGALDEGSRERYVSASYNHTVRALPEDSNATIDADFPRDVEAAVESHPEALDASAWE